MIASIALIASIVCSFHRQSCIERLLAREPAQRLGAHQNGADIAAHEFFSGLSWPDLLARQIRPPFKSKSGEKDDTQNFHRAFTNQKPIDSMDKASVLSPEQERNFEGFTYIPGQLQKLSLASTREEEPGGGASADAQPPAGGQAQEEASAQASSGQAAPTPPADVEGAAAAGAAADEADGAVMAGEPSDGKKPADDEGGAADGSSEPVGVS